jgi:hypothetical protein
VDVEDSAAASFSASVPANWVDITGAANGVGFFKVSTNVSSKWSNW